LVGRPNVGKSTLFNRLVGQRAALVDDQPGVTRDRIFGEMRHVGRVVRIIDTGGFDPAPEDDIMARVREQTQLAIDEADLVILVLDGQVGLQPADREVAQLLRRAGKRAIAVGNKSDLPEHDERLADLYGLGTDPVAISAEHGRGVGELADRLVEELDAPAEAEAEGAPLPVAEAEPGGNETSRVEWSGGPVRVAVIGRPNAGKSSLVNRLLGETRVLESNVPGTTRDAIDSDLEVDGQPFVLVDTAGIRRKRSVADKLERFSVMVALRSLERADVAMVLLDSALQPSEHDAKVVAMAHERGKGVVLVANKWDTMDAERGRDWVLDARHKLPFVDYAPLLRVSALSGRGVGRLLPAVVGAQQERHRRIGTAELNRFFQSVVASHPPPVRKGRRPRLYYVSQPLVRPPTFVFASSHPERIAPSYRRYLANNLRQRYGFEGTPIWIKMRSRSSNA
jgi:GTP-binding protein